MKKQIISNVARSTGPTNQATSTDDQITRLAFEWWHHGDLIAGNEWLVGGRRTIRPVKGAKAGAKTIKS